MENAMSMRLPQFLRRFAADRSGATAIEYGIILLLVVTGIITIIGTIGGSLTGMLDAANGGFN
jgi:pilus assembly protein Flp/PilA